MDLDGWVATAGALLSVQREHEAGRITPEKEYIDVTCGISAWLNQYMILINDEFKYGYVLYLSSLFSHNIWKTFLANKENL